MIRYKYLVSFGLVLVRRNNRTIELLFVYTKANYRVVNSRAAAIYHANDHEGVPVKWVWELRLCYLYFYLFDLGNYGHYTA